jgi:hypothetical protein
MAFALRYSVLPLIDTIMQFAFHRGAEYCAPTPTIMPAHEWEIERSAINLQRFSRTKHFETELQRHSKPNARARKAPDA